MRATLAFVGVCSILFCFAALLRGDDKPPQGNSSVTISPMRIQTVPAMNYLYIAVETTFAKMGDPIKEGFDRVFGAASDAKLLIARPTMLVYQGGPHFDPQKTFKMEFGVIIADDAKLPDLPADGDIKVRKTAPFKCATILYTGPIDQQGQAYQKLIPALTAAGHTPTGEEREMCLYWEGLDSPNNVFQMQIGIK
jgi:effector-binding domain-containing protein